MSNSKDLHVTGKYMVLTALISAAALFGSIRYKYNLENSPKIQPPKVESVNSLKEQMSNTEKALEEKRQKIKQQLDNANAGTFRDERDGQIYKWIRLKDGKKWMAENLNFETRNSWCYENETKNCDKYGRLYTWIVAKEVCPSGWHLPSDGEWWKMASYYGKDYNYGNVQQKRTTNNVGQAVYKTLIKGGSSNSPAVLGGIRYSDGFYDDLDDLGIYWNSTEKSSADAWYYYYDRYRQLLYGGSDNKSVGMSCRCIQD